ncbi:MAG: Rrf2 family transcriptional regulator [SAR116 cluster bacterium]|nr:MAG: Rrf2 family transcriptional regulator [SAR116 cluster bacterium]|tara:strand:- start:3570 stop:4019 length:450 start_codon:yes stop_codon:yes gene_type:complete
MKLTKRTMLAMEAVLDVAHHARPNPVQAREITKRQKIPERYLEQVMQQLVHTGILKGVRGPRGGYVLAQERRKITLGDIIRVVEQSAAETEQEDLVSSELGQRVIQPVWLEMEDKMLEYFSKITLEDLCQRADALGIGGTQTRPDNYTI